MTIGIEHIEPEPVGEDDEVIKRFKERQAAKKGRNGAAAIAKAASVHIPGSHAHDNQVLMTVTVGGKPVGALLAEDLKKEFSIPASADPRAPQNRLTEYEQIMLKRCVVGNTFPTQDTSTLVFMNLVLRCAAYFTEAYDKASADAAQADADVKDDRMGIPADSIARRHVDYSLFQRVQLDEACQIVCMEQEFPHLAFPIYLLLTHSWNDILGHATNIVKTQ